jgi:hypothetical protein
MPGSSSYAIASYAVTSYALSSGTIPGPVLPPPIPVVLAARALANTRLQFNLPQLYGPGSTMRVLAEAIAPEVDMIWGTIDELPLQTYVEHATWGIEHLELTVGLPVRADMPLEERRNAVRAIKIPSGPVHLEAVKTFLARFPYGTVDVQYTPGKFLTITFEDVRGIPSQAGDVQAGLHALLPAWIDLEWNYRFTTWAELKSWGVTWADLKALRLTWGDLKTWVPAGPISAASQANNLSLTFTQQASVIAEPGNLSLTLVQPNNTIGPGG